MRRRSILVVALLLGTSACAGKYASLPPMTTVAGESYRLGPGDEVRLSVFGFDAMANNYTVSDAGTISLPMLSTIAVEGKSTAELETAIATLLRERELAPNAVVSAQVQKYRPFYILGEVQKPGQYPYVPGMSVLTAVSIAGGYTFRANTNFAAVTRVRNKSPVNGRVGQDTPILPGDTITVPEAWF